MHHELLLDLISHTTTTVMYCFLQGNCVFHIPASFLQSRTICPGVCFISSGSTYFTYVFPQNWAFHITFVIFQSMASVEIPAITVLTAEVADFCRCRRLKRRHRNGVTLSRFCSWRKLRKTTFSREQSERYQRTCVRNRNHAEKCIQTTIRNLIRQTKFY